ncbi:MAG: 3'-5' exonuclease [Candidatus Peribacteraceae bacterium]|nr:3'-5' exonuclease [Candidatus Peribacteraceae bacterium]
MLPPLTIFDIETTGLDPQRGHRIVEIAAVRLENGKILDEHFVTFVNPERDIPWDARQVNKISDEDVKNAPTIDLVLPQFLEFANGSTLIAHNAQFDYGFLESEKQYCWGFVDLPECLCTMILSRNLYPAEFRHSLDVLCKRFNLEVPVDRHRALADVLLTTQALQKMLDSGKILSFEELKKRAGVKTLAKSN